MIDGRIDKSAEAQLGIHRQESESSAGPPALSVAVTLALNCPLAVGVQEREEMFEGAHPVGSPVYWYE